MALFETITGVGMEGSLQILVEPLRDTSRSLFQSCCEQTPMNQTVKESEGMMNIKIKAMQ